MLRKIKKSICTNTGIVKLILFSLLTQIISLFTQIQILICKSQALYLQIEFFILKKDFLVGPYYLQSNVYNKLIEVIIKLLNSQTSMQEENLITTLGPKLKEKSQQNITYRKAANIYQSLIQSTTAIPNYHQTIANTQNNFALFVFGSVFKLLSKAITNQKDHFNLDAYVLLMGLTVNKVNLQTLQQTGILAKVEQQIFHILTWNESSPLMIRHSISILNYTLNVSLQNQSTRAQSLKIVQRLFEISIENARNNIVSKESSKLLSLIVRNNLQIGKLLANEVKKNLLQGLQNRQQLYLNNVRQVIAEFPLPLINDIVYRSVKNLVDLDHQNQTNEIYLSQLYFFIEKLVDKLSISTLEEVLKSLIDNIPPSNNSQKIVFCYLQSLYEIILEFTNKNTKVAMNYLSSIISIFQQFLLTGGKTQKHSFSLLKFLMKNTIRQPLWTQIENDDVFGIQNINLEGSSGNHNFGKVICMLKSMLSTRFPNKKFTSAILCEFFESLSTEAFNYVQELIVEVINYREQFEQKSFKRVVHSIFVAFGPKRILEMYTPTIQGDISQQNFEESNNLWIVGVLEKYNGQEEMQVYGQYFVPLLGEIKNITTQENISKVRKQAYLSIADMIWHCFKVFTKTINKKTNYESVLELIDNQINQVSQSTLDHISVGLERLCQNLYKNEYNSKISQNLIKHFAASLNLEKANSKQILQAIKSLSLITNKDYLNRVFQKNIVKLLEACDKGTIASDETIQTNLKNLEILMSVCTGINFNDPTVISTYRVSKEELVIKLIQFFINEKNILQKKGYKFILQTINIMPQSFTQEIVEIIENDEKVLPASKHYRIAILYQLWRRLKGNDESQRNIENIFNFIKSYLPQILIALKQSNKRARKQAVKLFEQFYELLNEMGLVENFVEIICAGFTSNRTEIKIATIYGLTQIILKKDLTLQKPFLEEVFQLVLILLKEKKHEIYKAVIDYSKKYIFKLQKSEQLLILPNLINELFTVDEESKMEERSILKHFLLKLVKKHTRENVEKMIPQDDRKILSNAIKVENRLKKKKREQNILRKQQMQLYKKNKKAAQSQSSSDESQQAEKLQNQMKDQGEEEQLEALENTDNLLLKYDLEKENFHFEEKKVNILNEQRNLRKQKEQQKREDVVFDEDGFMVVKDDLKRRRRDETDANEMNEEAKQGANAYLNVKKKVKTDTVHQVKESGEAFRSNRAGGDVRRKDQPQPYAFIQFNQKALNKRFKKKAEKIFDTIFERKQGGLKGIKSRVLTKV